MSTEETDSKNAKAQREAIKTLRDAGVVYSDPFSPAAAGMEEAARAFIYNSAQPLTAKPALTLAVDAETKQSTEQALEAKRNAALSRLESLLGRTMDSDLRDQLQKIIDAVKNANSIDAIDSALEHGSEAITKASSSMGSSELDAASKAELSRLDRIIDHADKELRAMGYEDKEYDKQLAALQKELAGLQEGSDEWKRKQLEIAKLQKEHFHKMGEAAEHDPNRQRGEAAKEAAKRGEDAAEQKFNMWESRNKRRENQDREEVLPSTTRERTTSAPIPIKISLAEPDATNDKLPNMKPSNGASQLPD